MDRMSIIENDHNPGITKSLNQGLRIITTPYVARIDGDDWWEPTKLEKQLEFLENNPDHEVVGTNYINFKNSSETKITVPEKNEDIKKYIYKRNPFAHSSVVFKTDLVKKLGGYDSNIYMGQDYDLWLRCMPNCKFHNLQGFLCHRSIEGGISFDKQREQMLQCLKTQKKYIQKYKASPLNYFFMLEPLLVVLAPDFIRKIKRKLIQ
jgi:glycosyltransferase involved in cell wall biosynthesis